VLVARWAQSDEDDTNVPVLKCAAGTYDDGELALNNISIITTFYYTRLGLRLRHSSWYETVSIKLYELYRCVVLVFYPAW